MKDEERALQIYSVLALAAREQKVLSYSQIHKLTGMAKEMGRELGHIAAYCMKRKLPLLNLLAVNEREGKPGAEFLKVYDLPSEQTRVFLHDWMADGAPTAEALADAYLEAQDENKFAAVP